MAIPMIGCSKTIPDELQPVLEGERTTAAKIAEAAAAACPAFKLGAPFQPDPMAAPKPSVPHPAKGTSLESNGQVKDVLVMCSWPDPRDASGTTWGGTAMPALKGTNSKKTRPVTMPEDMARNTCKNDRTSCEQIVVPSRYLPSETSADLLVVRPTPDGGTAEVTVIFASP